jgi:hypothetical protein
MAVSRWVFFKIFVCFAFIATSRAQTTDVLSSTPENTPTKYTFRFPLGTPTLDPAPSSIFYSPTASAPLRPAFVTEVPPLDTRTWKLNPTVGFRSGFSTQEVPAPFFSLPTQGAAFNVSGRDVFLPCLADRFLQWALQSVINR